MATKKRTTQEKEIKDYRHDAKRKNNPSCWHRSTRKNTRKTETGIHLQSTPSTKPPI